MSKSWNPQFYIVYPRIMVDQIEWPEGCDYRCVANLAPMLQDKLNCKSIGAEIKLIWNYEHRKIIMENNKVTSEEIDDYVKADCNMLSFLSERTRERAIKFLTKIGGDNFICVDSYRNVILQQVFYKKHHRFSKKDESVKVAKTIEDARSWAASFSTVEKVESTILCPHGTAMKIEIIWKGQVADSIIACRECWVSAPDWLRVD